MTGTTTSFFTVSSEEIDYRGHLVLLRRPPKDLSAYSFIYDAEEDETPVFFTNSFYSCTKCPQNVEYFRNSASGKIKASTNCTGEISEIVTEVNFKSGKVVVSDSLHHANLESPDPSGEDGAYLDYNTFYGQKEYVKHYANSLNIAYGPVLNTSPLLYINKDTGELTVEMMDEDRFFEDDFSYGNKKFLAQIITDLWAYSIMDYEEWLATEPPEDIQNKVTVVDIPAGKYQFTHYACDPRIDISDLTILASAKKIG